MNITELVEKLSVITGASKRDTRHMLKMALALIRTELLDEGNDVEIRGFGKFKMKVSKPRMAFGKMTKKKRYISFKAYPSTDVMDGDEVELKQKVETNTATSDMMISYINKLKEAKGWKSEA